MTSKYTSTTRDEIVEILRRVQGCPVTAPMIRDMMLKPVHENFVGVVLRDLVKKQKLIRKGNFSRNGYIYEVVDEAK